MSTAREQNQLLPLDLGDDVPPRLVSATAGRDRKAYLREVALRWSGQARLNANFNWQLLEEHHDDLVAILIPFLRDCWCKDIAGTSHNPDGTLTAWLWKCSKANWWIWDFCNHYQTCHLRRGLIIYCKQVIAEIETDKLPLPATVLEFFQ